MKTFTVHFSQPKTHTTNIEANTANEAEEKFWNNENSSQKVEIMDSNELNIEGIYDYKGNYLYSKKYNNIY